VSLTTAIKPIDIIELHVKNIKRVPHVRPVPSHTFILARFRVDERRLELEHLERRIFPTGRTVVHQDSASSLEGAPSATDDSTTKVNTHLEQAFEKLKAVTGIRFIW